MMSNSPACTVHVPPSLPTKKLVDYTKQGKALPPKAVLNTKSSNQLQPPGHNMYRKERVRLQTESKSESSPDHHGLCCRSRASGHDESITALLKRSMGASEDGQGDPIDFYLKIPTTVELRTRQRTDLRERFSRSRTSSKSFSLRRVFRSSHQNSESEFCSESTISW